MPIKQKLKQKLLLATINGLAWLLPFISARLSYQLWTSTYRHKRPAIESEVFRSANKQKIDVDGTGIMTYAWGNFDEHRPLVLLLHGWNGRGTQLSLFAKGLVAGGFNVLAFDARGHGLSDGNHTNVLQSVAIIKKLSLIYGDFFAMIGHSFGAMCAVNAINQGVTCQKLIGISPPTEFAALLQVFANYLGLNSKASTVLEKYVLHKYCIDSFEQISITGIAPKMKIPLLIIHDKNDDKVPLSQGQKATELWGGDLNDPHTGGSGSGAKLHITEGLGHVRILRNLEVLDTSLHFLNEFS